MHILTRGDIPQRLRLGSGLILFLFALTHFLNTAVGLVSLEQMDQIDRWRVLVTRSLAGTIFSQARLSFIFSSRFGNSRAVRPFDFHGGNSCRLYWGC